MSSFPVGERSSPPLPLSSPRTRVPRAVGPYPARFPALQCPPVHFVRAHLGVSRPRRPPWLVFAAARHRHNAAARLATVVAAVVVGYYEATT